MSAPLSAKMEPIVNQSLEQVGAVQAYNAALGQYRTLPFVPDVQADLTQYVVDKGMDGVFYYLAQEEAAIRKDPAKRTTELLQKVFGGNIAPPLVPGPETQKTRLRLQPGFFVVDGAQSPLRTQLLLVSLAVSPCK